MVPKRVVAPRGKHESKQKLARALGDTARGARKREALTQADVAERIGLATEVYGRLERGLLMPSVPTLRRLCLALRLPADALLSLDMARPPAWTEAPAPPEEEGPEMRRLMRHVRKLTAEQLKALALVAATLRREE
ncbi:helix-turn-helix domain-containing protein [[Archangium] primigenium]|uniref:helix-turn-helix domain-containing protein n=1 Tax=Melittangium TaxID=44 RepID=UPI001957498C|nr:helix-turn-helix transcriptional regulator [Archangium primigenium]MBM7119415.1 helix-turn-helix domain-containing protein [Archangium primigenium]